MSNQGMKTTVIKLALVHRDIRILDGSRTIAVVAGVNRGAGAFSRTITRRYGFGARYWQRLELVFRILRNAWNYFDVHHHRSMADIRSYAGGHSVNRYVAPRVSVGLAVILRQVRQLAASPQLATKLPVLNRAWLDDKITILTRAQASEAKAQSKMGFVERLAHQVVNRNTRTQSRTYRRMSQEAISPYRTEHLNPPKIVYRQHPRLATEKYDETKGFDQQDSRSRDFSTLPMTPQIRSSAEHMAPINAEQLTEQVVRAIDQKIIAQRERLGRG